MYTVHRDVLVMDMWLNVMESYKSNEIPSLKMCMNPDLYTALTYMFRESNASASRGGDLEGGLLPE
jgi:hypothetical protein